MVAATVWSCSSALAALACDPLVDQRRAEIDGGASSSMSSSTSSSAELVFRKGSSSTRSIGRGAVRKLLLLGDHFLDRREDVFHRGFTAGRLHSPTIASMARRSHAAVAEISRVRAVAGGGVGAGSSVEPSPEIGGAGSMRAGSICGVTIGLAGISCGLTVRVAIGGWRGSLAQSFQLFGDVPVIAERIIERPAVEPEILRLRLAHRVEQLEAGDICVALRGHERDLRIQEFLLGVQHFDDGAGADALLGAVAFERELVRLNRHRLGLNRSCAAS